MLDIVAFIVFASMALRVVLAVKRESAIFAEFHQSQALAYAALLFPLGPVAMLVVGIRAPWVAVSVCAACYIPSLLLARNALARFERAGTDRTKPAMSAAWEALGTAIAGLAYAAVPLAFLLGLAFLRGPTDA